MEEKRRGQQIAKGHSTIAEAERTHFGASMKNSIPVSVDEVSKDMLNFVHTFPLQKHTNTTETPLRASTLLGGT